MEISAHNQEEYIAQLPDERQSAIRRLRQIITENLPNGFEEAMSYGMIGYVVPHSIYPNGYHCKPEEPLPFISIASQRNYIAFYHMGLYAIPHVLEWFQNEYPKHVKTKLDMGKGCVRFKKVENIPYALLAELCTKITVEEYVQIYENVIKKGK